MFGIFKGKSKVEKLQMQYEKLMKESFDLSKHNRKAADQKFVEAQSILAQIEELTKS
jgi:hypothetical protein